MTDKYAVFGNPIVQSKSPLIHNAFAKQAQDPIAYDKQLVEVGGFTSAADTFFAEGGKGLNITMPFKQDAFEYADTLSERAELAGAVNTLAKRADGTIFGDNTDGFGLVFDISERLGWSLRDKNILVLGAGGAVRGVLLPLLQQNPKRLVVANRTAEKARALADLFAPYGKIEGRAYAFAEEERFDVIINGTSASLNGDVPPIDPAILSASPCLYDMVYGAEPTAFMRWASEHDVADIADGIGMLVGQAAESFYIWRGKRPQMDTVIDMLRAQTA